MVYSLGIQNRFLLNGLVNIPGYVMEAIFIIGLIRYILFKEPMFIWGKIVPPPDNDQKPLLYSDPKTRETAVKAGIGMYLLIRIILVAALGMLLDFSQMMEHPPSEPPPPTLAGAIMGLVAIWVIIWALRLVWIYIPVAMGYSFIRFLQIIKGFNSSLSIFAAWFLCYLPIVILLAGLFNLLNLITSDGSMLQIALQETLKIIGELAITMLPVITLTYGFFEILSGKKSK